MEQQIRELVERNKDYTELLERIVNYEQEKEEEWRKEPSSINGFEWEDVSGPPAMLTQLLLQGILKCVYKSRSSKIYRLSDKEKVKKVLKLLKSQEVMEVTREKIKLDTASLFKDIVGFDDVKSIIRKALGSNITTHFMFIGPPASAKTEFLLSLSELQGSDYVLGSSSSRAGLTSMLFEKQPKILLIDEIEKMQREDLAAILSLCQTGIVSETKFGRHRSIELKDTFVFACCNNVTALAKEVLSRFMKFKFREYTKPEFIKVVVNVLKNRENVLEELASHIAERVWNELETKDVREAIRIGRLCKSIEEVDEVINVLKGYR